MILLLVVLLEIYLRELRTESIYLPIKYPSLRKRGLFYDVAFSDFVRNIFKG